MNGLVRRALCAAALAAAAGCATVSEIGPDVTEIRLEGKYDGHLQDVWREGPYIYWAHTQDLLKTDLSGRIVRHARVEGHHAGLEVRDGRLYTAVCIMQGKTKGKTTPECRVTVGEYDAETLELVKMHVTDINDRSGSLTILDDGTFLVGCLRPQDIALTQVRFHHLDRDFRLIRSYVVDNVPVRLGIETLKRKNGFVYLGLYGSDKDHKKLDFDTVKLDGDYREVWRGRLGGSYGSFEDGRFRWIGKTVGRKTADGKLKGPFVSRLVRTENLLP